MLPSPARDGQVRLRGDAGYFAGELAPLWRILDGLGEDGWVEATEMDGAQLAVADYFFRDSVRGAASRHLPSGYPQVNTAWMWGALLAASIAGWLHQLTALPDPTANCSATASAVAKP
jgi:hypothetical protein